MRKTIAALSYALWLCALPASAQLEILATPLTLSLGLSGGASQSHLQCDSMLKSYFEPTQNIARPIAPAFGLDFEARIGRFAAISLGTKYQHRGEDTKTTTVKFNDDIFDHTLQTHAGFDYISMPLIVKGGYSAQRAWVFVRLGIAPSLLSGDSLNWVIDGQPASPGSNRMPLVSISQFDWSALVGCEAGVRFGRHGVFATLDYLHGLTSVSSSLSGYAYNRAYEACVGYRYFFQK